MQKLLNERVCDKFCEIELAIMSMSLVLHRMDVEACILDYFGNGERIYVRFKFVSHYATKNLKM